MEIDETGWGENIWDASSWRTDITNKEELIKSHLDELQFPESQAHVMDFVETYYTGVFERDDPKDDSEPKFVNSYIVSGLVDEFIFGVMDDETFTALQELKLLEVICSWFYEKKVDALAFAVFDTLFSNMFDESVPEEMKVAKFEFLKKLASFGVGVKCRTLMDCIAIWIQRLGVKDDTCLQLMSSIIYDYCCLVPGSVSALKNVVRFSPLFAFQMIVTLPKLYSFSSEEEDEGESKDIDEEHPSLPNDNLIIVVANWIVSSPDLLDIEFPEEYLEFPSIVEANENTEKGPNDTANLLLGLLKICFLTGLYQEQKEKEASDQSFSELNKNGKKSITKNEALYQILYGVLKFLSVQNKSQSKPPVSDDEDLEPGEVLDEEEIRPLIPEEQFLDLLNCIHETYESLKDSLPEEVAKDCTNKLAHVIQVGRASQTIGCTHDKLKGVFKRFPKTRLLSLVLNKLSG